MARLGWAIAVALVGCGGSAVTPGLSGAQDPSSGNGGAAASSSAASSSTSASSAQASSAVSSSVAGFSSSSSSGGSGGAGAGGSGGAGGATTVASVSTASSAAASVASSSSSSTAASSGAGGSPPVCSAPQSACGASCVDLAIDVHNCGTCGYDCGVALGHPGVDWITCADRNCQICASQTLCGGVCCASSSEIPYCGQNNQCAWGCVGVLPSPCQSGMRCDGTLNTCVPN